MGGQAPSLNEGEERFCGKKSLWRYLEREAGFMCLWAALILIRLSLVITSNFLYVALQSLSLQLEVHSILHTLMNRLLYTEHVMIVDAARKIVGVWAQKATISFLLILLEPDTPTNQTT